MATHHFSPLTALLPRQPRTHEHEEERAGPLTIGVPLHLHTREEGAHLSTDATCAWAIALLGGQPLFVPLWPLPPPDPPFAALWPLMHALDGLLLPAGRGSADADQAGWAAAAQVALIQLASAAGLPILALGEGAVTWNAALCPRREPRAGSEPAQVPPQRWPRKLLRPCTGSKLAGWLAQTAPAFTGVTEPPLALPVLPGKGVEPLAVGLRPCARTHGGHLLAFERRDAAFGLGLLARLDFALDQPAAQQLFAAFLQAAHHFAQARAMQPDWQRAGAAICSALAARLAAGLPVIGDEEERTTEPLPRLGPDGRPAREPSRSQTPSLRGGQRRPVQEQDRHRVPLPR